jgi:hypothetical protein
MASRPGHTRLTPQEEAARLREKARVIQQEFAAAAERLLQQRAAMRWAEQSSMSNHIVVHRYWIQDERTGQRRLTIAHMTEQEAARRYPGAVPEPSTREKRWTASSAAADASKGD